MIEKVGNGMQSIEDSLPRSLGSNSTLEPNKQAVQLPTICYPPGVTQPLLLDSQQLRPRTPFNLQGVQYRTTTFTQFQVAQTTFRYPPTPPVDISENMMSSQQQQTCEAPALSHMNYAASADAAASTDKTGFPSLPTPPDLVPISEIDSSSMSPQTCKNSTFYYPAVKQQWQHQSSDMSDMNSTQCLNTPAQMWPVSESTTPPSSSLLPNLQPSSTGGLCTSMQQAYFFQLPQLNQYGDGMFI